MSASAHPLVDAPCPFCVELPVSKCPAHARENYRCQHCGVPLTPDGHCPECGALFDWDNPVVRCRREQREAREDLDGPGTEKRGAKQATKDWLMEEALIEAEE